MYIERERGTHSGRAATEAQSRQAAWVHALALAAAMQPRQLEGS